MGSSLLIYTRCPRKVYHLLFLFLRSYVVPLYDNRVYIAPVLGTNQDEPYFLGMTKSVFTERYQTFISLLVSARQKQGLSQRDLAIKLNKVHSFVAKYEQGERRLDVIEFLDIAEALDLNPEAIIKKLRKFPK
jgi:DNA-binding transcriptional regulator YiaG